MGVFLRWGIFGIIAVAALVYAYKALGHLANRHTAPPAAVIAPPAPASAGHATAATSSRAERDAIPEHCQVELDVARRAAAARSVGEPLDRILRIQEIAWEKDEKRREHLTTVATHWYEMPGPIDPERLRRDVVLPCVDATLR